MHWHLVEEEPDGNLCEDGFDSAVARAAGFQQKWYWLRKDPEYNDWRESLKTTKTEVGAWCWSGTQSIVPIRREVQTVCASAVNHPDYSYPPEVSMIAPCQFSDVNHRYFWMSRTATVQTCFRGSSIAMGWLETENQLDQAALK
jgi:hypothetical protein